MNCIKTNYSQFSPSALLEELRNHYDLPTDAVCKFFKSGLNDIYKITTQDDTYFLRVSLSHVYNTLQVKEETAFIRHLLAKGLPVVEPIPCNDQSYVLELQAPEGMRQAVLFRGLTQTPTGDGNTRMYNLGKLIAQMHLASHSFQNHTTRPKIDENMLVTEPAALLKPHLMHRADDLAFLSKTAMPLWSAVDAMLSEHRDTTGFCHGDIQPSNFFFCGENPVLFDFDCMGYGYFAYDLGVLLANLTFMDNEIYQKSIWDSMIDGYRSVRPLFDDEMKAIFIFAALHMLRVLSYHAKLTEQNQGSYYFMTDHHLDTFFGAYKRLTHLADEKSNLQLLH